MVFSLGADFREGGLGGFNLILNGLGLVGGEMKSAEISAQHHKGVSLCGHLGDVLSDGHEQGISFVIVSRAVDDSVVGIVGQIEALTF